MRKRVIVLVLILILILVLVLAISSLLYKNKKDGVELIEEYENTKIYIKDKKTEKEKILIKQGNKDIIEITENNRVDAVNNIKIGDPIQKVIKENGKDFYLYGFEWDYGGMVFDWNGGKFKNGEFSVWFWIDGEYYPEDIEGLLGDKELYTGDLDLEKIKIVVRKIQKVND